MNTLSGFLFDKTETVTAVLGQNSVQRLLSEGVMSGGFAVLSDKRLYVKGECFVKNGTGYKASIEDRIIDLKDVAGSAFEETRRPVFLIGGIICSVLAIAVAVIILML